MFLKVTKTLALMCGFSRSQDALQSTKIPTVLVFKLMSNYIYWQLFKNQELKSISKSYIFSGCSFYVFVKLLLYGRVRFVF